MKTSRADTTTTILFIKPMYALAVQNIPEGEEWLYEVKFDGYRCRLDEGRTARSEKEETYSETQTAQ